MKKSLLIAAFVPFMAAVAAEEKSKDPAAEAAEKSARVQAMADTFRPSVVNVRFRLKRLPDGSRPNASMPYRCPACNNTGYRGRTAIHEIIHCTAKVSAIIAAGGGKEEIEQAAKANGTKLLRDNASELVQAGETSIDELVRSTFSV